MSNKIILAIETSCDETAIAILRSSDSKLELLTNQVSSQVKLHAKWGGVVPNLAAREHLKNFPKLLKMALNESKIKPEQIDLISTTSGPGLIPALLVGVNFAKTLSYLWEKPLIGIHHIEGHIYSNLINTISIDTHTDRKKLPQMSFPALCLVVSGGHTQLVLMNDHLKYEVIGQTLDDAVGEAFDKVARILGIGYPGGPAVSAMAEKFRNQNEESQKKGARNQNGSYRMQNTKHNIQFPRPMLSKKNFNFSFSGLKTAVLYEAKKHPELLKDKSYLSEICHEFQQSCVDVLVAKTIRAAQQYKPKTILLAGGVSANTQLRKQLGDLIAEFLPKTNYLIPEIALTGDNAAMIAIASYYRWEKMNDSQKKKSINNWKTMQPNANLKMK